MLTIRPSIKTVRLLAASLALLLAWEQAGVCQSAPSEQEQKFLDVLRGDAPGADKAIACKQLAIHGSSAAVADLAKLLDNPELASWSRIALEAIPGPEADEALRKATETLEGNLLIGAINSLGVRRDAGAVELLTARLNDKDPDLAIAAAVALGNIGNAAAGKALRPALASDNSEIRSGAAEGCILCAERFLASKESGPAVELYEEVRKADVPRQRKLEATRGAILARGEEGLPLLIEQLQSPDRAFFQIALSTIREFPGSKIDKSLDSELDRLAPERGALLISAMADRTDTVDLAAVLKAAEAGAKPVRLAAIGALGRVGNPSCLASLLPMTLEADADIAATAQTSIADLPGEGSVDREIVSRLSGAKGREYLVLIELVGQRRIDAVPALIKALDLSDAKVRGAALTSLGSTVSPKTLNVLITQVVSPRNEADLPTALQALKTAAVRMPDREACAAELSDALGRASSATKDSILEILSEMGGSTALQTIGAAAKSNDPQLQDTGSRLLGKWATEDAAPVLLDLAKNAPSDKYRSRAVKGYISLARRFKTMAEPERLEICQNALDVSRQLDERKLVLEVLRLYPTVGSLRLAIKAREIPDLKNDASEVAVDISRKIKGNAAEVQDILSKAGLDKAK